MYTFPAVNTSSIHPFYTFAISRVSRMADYYGLYMSLHVCFMQTYEFIRSLLLLSSPRIPPPSCFVSLDARPQADGLRRVSCSRCLLVFFDGYCLYMSLYMYKGAEMFAFQPQSFNFYNVFDSRLIILYWREAFTVQYKPRLELSFTFS